MSDLWNKSDDVIMTVATYKLAKQLGKSHADLSASSIHRTSGLYAYVKVIDYSTLTVHSVTVYDREVK